MTQEEKQLLLQDLCARLPYGVKINYSTGPANHCIFTLTELNVKTSYDEQYDLHYYPKLNGIYNYFDCLPYLRPMSSMTEEEMDRLFDILHIDKDGKDEDWIKINDVYGIKFFFPTGKWIENVAEAYDYLYSIHIDFRGLIHKGLAIEVTEDNNPYKD